MPSKILLHNLHFRLNMLLPEASESPNDVSSLQLIHSNCSKSGVIGIGPTFDGETLGVAFCLALFADAEKPLDAPFGVTAAIELVEGFSEGKAVGVTAAGIMVADMAKGTVLAPTDTLTRFLKT